MTGPLAEDLARAGVALCADIGSTYTKVALVDLERARQVAHAGRPTGHPQGGGDVADVLAACRELLAAADDRARTAPLLACSSAGGGLRVAVVGNEELVTSEAGRRVALSSGGRVVHVASGMPDVDTLAALDAAHPDVVLLVGGTDGGNREVLLANAEALSARATPVVLAGNVAARDEAAALVRRGGAPVVVADNVLPRIGELAPASARAAVRAMFLEHVIGGKHLTADAGLLRAVQGATPDVVLRAVELLARGLGDARPGRGQVTVVDVGGATTDVYSVVDVDPETAAHEVSGTAPTQRTVEGDLGLRWSAESTVAEAVAAGLVSAADAADLAARAARLAGEPSAVPAGPEEVAHDRRMAGWAAALAVRRHAGRAQVRLDRRPDGTTRVVERGGTDLSEVGLVVGSGGVFRHDPEPSVAAEVLRDALRPEGGWQVPRSPRVVLDADYLLMPAGLLAPLLPEVAGRLLDSLGG